MCVCVCGVEFWSSALVSKLKSSRDDRVAVVAITMASVHIHGERGREGERAADAFLKDVESGQSS